MLVDSHAYRHAHFRFSILSLSFSLSHPPIFAPLRTEIHTYTLLLLHSITVLILILHTRACKPFFIPKLSISRSTHMHIKCYYMV